MEELIKSTITFDEYGEKMPACLREAKPKCPPVAVIPSITVEDKTGMKALSDCFVHVSNVNTTFYIDDKHRITTIWTGPIEYANYDIEKNELGLRSQTVVDTASNQVTYFDEKGAPIIVGGQSSGSNVFDLTPLVPNFIEKVDAAISDMVANGTTSYDSTIIFSITEQQYKEIKQAFQDGKMFTIEYPVGLYGRPATTRCFYSPDAAGMGEGGEEFEQFFNNSDYYSQIEYHNSRISSKYFYLHFIGSATTPDSEGYGTPPYYLSFYVSSHQSEGGTTTPI